MRYAELRRHTDNEGDRLTPQGAADAEMIGRGGLHPPYAAFVSTGATRATQMLEILRHAAGQDDSPITAVTGLRASRSAGTSARSPSGRAQYRTSRPDGPAVGLQAGQPDQPGGHSRTDRRPDWACEHVGPVHRAFGVRPRSFPAGGPERAEG